MPRQGSDVSPLRAGLTCKCPRCGEGSLFKGFLTVAPACAACGLDYGKIDTGDGPAVFIIMILGFVVVGLALWVEVTFQPPYWLHFVLWLPLTLIGALLLLRPFKATLAALQYRNKATQEIELD
ncbi:DUF983 domain-containing protein [Oceanibacterium hippocampi]|uniref:DUF983 domain-containing protein n=1 Tax=Oceanibacterium hippocampi TaxID=745714 RepID=A0A1Y5SAF3_9PROT|nr:DUF983 domain-containing protein [Oceanibacterium hippocampi]SLN33291.1 hypothetical protein OCH7691_01279 [Oceanibacterium hippocampi]